MFASALVRNKNTVKREVEFLGEKHTFTHPPHKESKSHSMHIPLRKSFFILAISDSISKERPTKAKGFDKMKETKHQLNLARVR